MKYQALARWLAAWLAGWLAGCLLLAGELACRLIAGDPAGWLAAGLAVPGWLAGCGWLAGWLPEKSDPLQNYCTQMEISFPLSRDAHTQPKPNFNTWRTLSMLHIFI